MATSAITWVSFESDALVNMDSAIASFLYTIALRSGDDAPSSGAALCAEFAAIRDHQLLLPFRSYKRVLAETLRVWCKQLNYPWMDGYAEAIVLATRSAQPFPDSVAALRETRDAGLSLVLLADSDHDLVCHSLNHLRIDFEEVIVSEDAGIYKPAQQRLAQVTERTGVPPGKMLYVTADEHDDIESASQLGWTTAWVNRKASVPAPERSRPDHTWRDLGGLVALVGDAGSSERD